MSVSAIPNLETLVPILGVSYSPVPSDDTPAPPQKYFDTDFTNSTFPLIWGTDNSGRGDVKTLSDSGVNFLHLYNWSVPPAPGSSPGDYQRDHLPFLKECGARNVKAFVPISNYFLGQIHQGNGATVKADILAMVTEVYDNKPTSLPTGAGMWGIGNEYDLAGALFDVNDVVTAIEYLVDAENSLGIPAANTLPVTSPVSFAKPNTLPPGVVAIQNLQTAIEASTALGSKGCKFWSSRFAASTNPFNDGAYLKNYIDTDFPQYFPDLPFFFAEMGFPIIAGTNVSTPAEQAAFVKAQLAASMHRKNFLGCCVFQFLDQSAMKTGSEATFGMTKYSGTISTTGTIPSGYTPGGGDTYPVDVLSKKPLYTSVEDSYLAQSLPLGPGPVIPAHVTEEVLVHT